MLAAYTPMAPTQVREAFHREGWVYEEKVDGWRTVAYKDGDVSRNGRDHTRRFAGIAAAVAALSARSLVLDGEVAIYDQQLRSRFDWLREPDPDQQLGTTRLSTHLYWRYDSRLQLTTWLRSRAFDASASTTPSSRGRLKGKVV